MSVSLRRSIQSIILPQLRSAISLSASQQVAGSGHTYLLLRTFVNTPQHFGALAAPRSLYGLVAQHLNKVDTPGSRWFAHAVESEKESNLNPQPFISVEHANIANEIEKELSKADSVDKVLDIFAKFKDDFTGPTVATALLTLHQLTQSASADEVAKRVHNKPLFKALLGHMVKTQTFDAFTLMQVLDCMSKLHVDDKELLDATSRRMSELVKTMDSRHLLKLLQRTCKTQQMPTIDMLAVLTERADEIKDSTHPETKEDIELALKKLKGLLEANA